MLLGKITFGFVLGNIASTMANMETLRVLFEERYSGVINHMEDLRMPDALRNRVMKIFQYMWQRNKGSSNEGETLLVFDAFLLKVTFISVEIYSSDWMFRLLAKNIRI